MEGKDAQSYGRRNAEVQDSYIELHPSEAITLDDLKQTDINGFNAWKISV